MREYLVFLCPCPWCKYLCYGAAKHLEEEGRGGGRERRRKGGEEKGRGRGREGRKKGEEEKKRHNIIINIFTDAEICCSKCNYSDNILTTDFIGLLYFSLQDVRKKKIDLQKVREINLNF